MAKRTMLARRKITKAFTRFYSDNKQMVAYIEWSDGSRTEGEAIAPLKPRGEHMAALFKLAKREGLTVTHETW